MIATALVAFVNKYIEYGDACFQGPKNKYLNTILQVSGEEIQKPFQSVTRN